MAAKKAGLGKGLDSLIIPNKAKHTGDDKERKGNGRRYGQHPKSGTEPGTAAKEF